MVGSTVPPDWAGGAACAGADGGSLTREDSGGAVCAQALAQSVDSSNGTETSKRDAIDFFAPGTERPSGHCGTEYDVVNKSAYCQVRIESDASATTIRA